MNPIVAVLLAALCACGSGSMGSDGHAGLPGPAGPQGPTGTALVQIRLPSVNEFASNVFVACSPDSHVMGGGCFCTKSGGGMTALLSARILRLPPPGFATGTEGFQCDCAPPAPGETPMTGAQATCIQGPSVSLILP